MNAPEPGGLGGTNAGNPMARAAALAVLDVIKGENLCARADAIGRRTKAQLRTIAGRNDIVPVAAIRGPGAMIGFKIVRERGRCEPDADAAKRVTTASLDAGPVLLSCGAHGDAICILILLTVSDEVLDEDMDLLGAALAMARS